MQKTEKVMVCDVCGKKTSDEGSSWYGGHPFQGWYHLRQHGGGATLEELRRKKDWDICSKDCLKKFSNGEVPPQKDIVDESLDNFKEALNAVLDGFDRVRPKT